MAKSRRTFTKQFKQDAVQQSNRCEKITELAEAPPRTYLPVAGGTTNESRTKFSGSRESKTNTGGGANSTTEGRGASYGQIRPALFWYMEIWYNRKRLHSAPDYQTPVQVEHQLTQELTAA